MLSFTAHMINLENFRSFATNADIAHNRLLDVPERQNT
jgi:hypothetical protein